MTCQEARERFSLPVWDYKKIIRRWQERYSDEIHLSLRAMSAKERTEVKALEKRIGELEKQLERAQMKNVALNTMIDIAETDYKLAIRKKSGSKQ
jgi:predicted RNase H-like nuclease (RuvC/YqgF family)